VAPAPGRGVAVSFMDNPPHVVIVQNYVKNRTARGLYEDVPSGPPIEVRCSVQSVREWSSAEEIPINGLQLLTLCRIFCRTWPGDARSIITWAGFEWETVGEPQPNTSGKRTNHWAITVRRRGAET
jgi:hypothetical protein